MKNQQIVGFTAVAFFLIASACQCANLGFKSDNEFEEWMTFYYQNPSPERIPMALTYFSDSALYKTNATTPTVAFFSALFKKNTKLMQKTFDDISLNGSDNTKIMLINILFMTNDSESKALLGKAQGTWQSERMQGIITRQMARPYNDLYSIPVDSPLILDMLWASFFATGDPFPVQKIISVIHLLKDGHGEEIIVGGAANWSLKSIVQQHAKVIEICKQELTNAQGETKVLLEEIVK